MWPKVKYDLIFLSVSQVSEVDIHAESRSQSLLTLKNEGKISEDSETVANGQQL